MRNLLIVLLHSKPKKVREAEFFLAPHLFYVFRSCLCPADITLKPVVKCQGEKEA